MREQGENLRDGCDRSTWRHRHSTTVGYDAIGSLTIKDGGTCSGGLFLGFNAGAQGTVIVTGVGSSVSASTALIGIHTGSISTAVIEKGGTWSGVDITLGSAGGNGNLTVTDAGFTLNASLVVGLDGTGTVTVANGGTVVSTLRLGLDLMAAATHET
jgi:T5SS/PEP-CTERM-associated repeat protein